MGIKQNKHDKDPCGKDKCITRVLEKDKVNRLIPRVVDCDEHDHSKDSIPGGPVQWKQEQEKGDNVFRPKHYTQWKIEPFTFLMLNRVPFAEASVCKYVLRWRKKNGLEDLKKAKRIIDMMIEMTINKEDYIAKKTCL